MNRLLVPAGIFVALTSFLALTSPDPAPAKMRAPIKIVGSSTIFPYTDAVARTFAKKTGQPTPAIEETGTGGGMALFCEGFGKDEPDIAEASRPMKRFEWDECVRNGVDDITQLQIGSDGLSIARSREGGPLSLSETDLFLALAADVPDGAALIPNPNKTWRDANPALPDEAIIVYGPPLTSGTRDAFADLAMHDGCRKLGFFKAKQASMTKAAFEKLVQDTCTRLRQDGAYIEAGEDDAQIVKRIEADPRALGIFGYSFLYMNRDRLQAVKVEGKEPNFDDIADGSYAMARTLFLYVKNANRGIAQEMDSFLTEYLSDDAMGPHGYLHEEGLVAPGNEALKEMRERLRARTRMSAPVT